MTCLEMISVRTGSAMDAAKALDICREISQSVQIAELLKIDVYCNAAYPTDVSIHLHWKSDPGFWSILGREVNAALGDLGLVSHTLWIEQEGSGICDMLEIGSKQVA